jgi:hypothetical protein
MLYTELEARVTKLEAFTGIAESAETEADGGQMNSEMSDAYRLTYLVVAEIMRDFAALERTSVQRDADHSRHLFKVGIKYAMLKGYLDKDEVGVARALRDWPGPEHEADSLAEQVRCRFCGSEAD